MKRLVLVLAATFALAGAQAQEVDMSDLSPEEQEIVASLQTTAANAQNKENAVKFWRKAPENLKARIMAAPKEKRWPIILCNYLGFNIGTTGRTDPELCEGRVYADIQRGQQSWSADGQWVGPSEECRARNQRNEYGQLICS